ncbi:MAG: hypothetical protein KAV44_08750 [Bacteroidales bacterium]|nr:hypothetical protein [Bacteroidales bacterium]
METKILKGNTLQEKILSDIKNEILNLIKRYNKVPVIALIVLCCLNSLNAQDTFQKIKIYRTWVSLNSEPFKIKGVLYEVKDSSILVSRSVVIQDYSTDSFEIAKLNINNIETIKTRRKNSIGKGVLIGAVSGLVVGVLIGLIDGDDPPCPSGSWICLRYTAGQKALMAGVPLAVSGAGIGALIGSIKVKIPINGNINNYNRNKNKLRKYTIKEK